MKSFVTSVIVILVCFWFEPINAREIPDSCTALFFPHIPEQGYFNPDSVLYDTCQCKSYEKFQCTYIFARQWYEVIFNNKDPYNLLEFPYDTIVERTWQNLDSSYVELRNMFQNVESLFGTFILRKRYPEETDSTSLGSRSYLIKFQNFCKIDSVVNLIDTSGLVYDFYYRNALFHDDTYYVDDQNKYVFEVKLLPNPCTDFIEIKLKNNITESLIFSIIDIFGIEIQYQNIIIQNPDEFTIKINTSNLSMGIYTININNGKHIIKEKFIRIK